MNINRFARLFRKGPGTDLGKVLSEHIKPTHHVLSIGPYIPFRDPSPLWAVHLTKAGGKTTVMDSQSGALDMGLHARGKVTGRGSSGLGTGDLGWFKLGMASVARHNGLPEPKYVMGRMQEIPLKKHSVDTILTKNMLFGLWGDRRDGKRISGGKSLGETLDEYDRVLKPGGQAIEIKERYISSGENGESIADAFRKRGYDVRVYDGVQGVTEIPGFIDVGPARKELGAWFQESKPGDGSVIVAKKPNGVNILAAATARHPQ